MAIAGLHAALIWHREVGIDKIRMTEQAHFAKLLDILSGSDCIEIIGNPQTASSIISCIFKGLPTDVVASILSQRGIVVRSGLHCAPLAHKFLGTYPAGTVRFSVSYFTSQSDFEMLKSVLSEIEEG
jgi:selenocysteine lyase/cysteine desulfurase